MGASESRALCELLSLFFPFTDTSSEKCDKRRKMGLFSAVPVDMMASRSSQLVGHLFCFSSPCVWRFRLNRLAGRSVGYFQFYLFLQQSAKTWWTNNWRLPKSAPIYPQLIEVSTFSEALHLPHEMYLPGMACIKTSYLPYKASDFLHVFSTSLTFTNKKFSPEQTGAKAGMQKGENVRK